MKESDGEETLFASLTVAYQKHIVIIVRDVYISMGF
jgi:hypothetical protein